MANPRQRRKARSSSYKPVSHSRNAKRKLKKMPPICGPKVLQDAWDSTKTVRQNYASIGLAHTLSPSTSGGVELHKRHESIDKDQAVSEVRSSIPKGYGRIIRDDRGNVAGVEIPEEVDEPKRDLEEMREPELDGDELKSWVTDLGGSSKGGSDVVQIGRSSSTAGAHVGRHGDDDRGYIWLKAEFKLGRYSHVLERISTRGSRPRRHASAGETRYLERLVEKYGDDVERMAVDGKLNAEQRTAGSLRRALGKASRRS